MTMVISETSPEADGICFSDIFPLDEGTQRMLMARELVFLTEFHSHNQTYGGNVIAKSWEAAEEIADARGLGEKVIGTLGRIIAIKDTADDESWIG